MELWAIRISAVALMVSGVSLWISWRAHKRDEPHLRLTLHYHPESGAGTEFRIRVVNHGRRVCLIERAMVVFASGERLEESFVGGKPLEESQSTDVWFPLYDKPLRSDIPVGVVRAEVYDTLGKRHVYPRMSPKSQLEFRKLKRKIRTEWEAYMRG